MAWITLPCGLIQFPLTVPHTILLGSQVPGTGGAGSDGSQPPAQYYAAMEGDSQIYTIGSYLTETAAKGLYDFVETESLPHVEGADIREITVSRNGQTSRFCKRLWMTRAI